MSNFVAAIKDEIRRLAKREIKAATSATKQAVNKYRRDIAALKRLLRAQQKEIAFLTAQERKRLGPAPAREEEPAETARYSPRSVRAQRRRLGLSLNSCAKLLGVTPLTVYHWESGKSRPKPDRVAALVALRKLGKREVRRRLALLGGEPAAKRRPRKTAK
jgi:DNA-binding transcriptional regulator YiaG